MKNYKKTLCALLVTASVAGTSSIIAASTDKKDTAFELPSSNTKSVDEIMIPKRIVYASAEVNELESVLPKKVMNVKDVQAADEKYKNLVAKLEAEKLAAKKAEEAKLAAEKKAKEEKLAAEKKAKEAKLAAEKAEKAKQSANKTAAARNTTRVVASRGTTVTSVSSEKAHEIINYAKQFMGVKYVFGGASPSGFDCSGFTMYVFQHFGISLPHSAKSQAAMGTAVSKSNLIPGDLVFFETYQKGISHVGIYIGNGNFIEASSSRGIAITSLSSSYYKNRYMGATRILK